MALLASLATQNLHSTNMAPLKFFGLLSPNQEEARSTLQWCKHTFGSLTKLEEVTRNNPKCDAFVRDLVFPCNSWIRQVLVRAMEEASDLPPEDLKADILDFARCPNSTLVKELTFNYYHRAASSNRKGAFSPSSAWHRALVSPLLPEHDRPTCPVTQAAKLAKAPALACQTFCFPKIVTSSFSEEVCKTFTQGRPSWPTLSSERYNESVFAAMKMNHFGGDWAKMEKSWLSVCCQQGTLLKRVGAGNTAVLVLKATAHGLLGWEVSFVKRHGVAIMQLLLQRKALQYIVVEDPKDWRILEVECRPPADLVFIDPTTMSLAVVVKGKGRLLLEAAADGGLRGLTVAHLRDLWRELDVPVLPGGKPATKDGLREQIIAFIKGVELDAAAKIVKDADCEENVDELLAAERGLLKCEDDELLDDDEADEFQVELESMRAAVVVRRARSASGPGAHAIGSTGAVPAADSGDSGSSSSGAKRFVSKPPDGEGFSQAQAAAYLPPLATITKGVTRELYWQVRSPDMPCSRSKRIGGLGGFSDWAAMVFCIQLAWRAHESKVGTPCPFEFECPGMALAADEV